MPHYLPAEKESRMIRCEIDKREILRAGGGKAEGGSPTIVLEMEFGGGSASPTLTARGGNDERFIAAGLNGFASKLSCPLALRTFG
jgi:hypothetical protein